MNFKILTASAAFAAIGLGVVWLATAPETKIADEEPIETVASKRPRPNRASVTPASAEVGDVRNSVRSLSRELEEIRAAQADAPDPAEPVAESDEPESVERSVSDQRAIEQEDGSRMIAAFDSAFADEKRDSGWAAGKEGEFGTLFASGELGAASLVEAECRSQICRVVVDTGKGDREAILDEIMHASAFSTSGFYGPDPDDASRLRLFVSREGTDLGEHPSFLGAMDDGNG